MSDLPEWVNRLVQATENSSGEGEHANCQADLPALIEAELAGEDVGGLYGDTLAHLQVCQACDATYAAMLDLALAEAADRLPTPDHYPRVQLPVELQLRKITEQVLGPVFEQQLPGWIEQLGERLEAFFARLTSLPPGQLVTAQPGIDTDADNAQIEVRIQAIYMVLVAMLAQYSHAELQTWGKQGQLAQRLRQLVALQLESLGLQVTEQEAFIEQAAVQFETRWPAVLALSERWGE